MVEEKDIDNLALLLLYLSCWDENGKKAYSGKPVLRAWKNIRFEVLNKLAEKGLINDSKGSKSVYFTDAGVKKAEELKKKFGGLNG